VDARSGRRRNCPSVASSPAYTLPRQFLPAASSTTGFGVFFPPRVHPPNNRFRRTGQADSNDVFEFSILFCFRQANHNVAPVPLPNDPPPPPPPPPTPNDVFAVSSRRGGKIILLFIKSRVLLSLDPSAHGFFDEQASVANRPILFLVRTTIDDPPDRSVALSLDSLLRCLAQSVFPTRTFGFTGPSKQGSSLDVSRSRPIFLDPRFFRPSASPPPPPARKAVWFIFIFIRRLGIGPSEYSFSCVMDLNRLSFRVPQGINRGPSVGRCDFCWSEARAS